VIDVKNLRYRIGAFSLDVSLDVRDGEYFVLLGMTGSGKTLFLESLCGLRTITSGSASINGRAITFAEPRKRRIGYVPQDGALFENMNVENNISFSLRVAGALKEVRKSEARRLASLLGIDHLLGRSIRGLSGGEKQRVLLARALAGKPEALCLDEPVSALDEYTREGVCRELRKLHADMNLSVIHICHSSTEAKLVADRIGIMHEGRIVQTGTIDEISEKPASLWAAKILRLENVFSGRAYGAGKIDCNGFILTGPAAEGEVLFYIRPWGIRILSESDNEINTMRGRIAEIHKDGPIVKVALIAPFPIVVHVGRSEAGRLSLSKGSLIKVGFADSAVHIVNK